MILSLSACSKVEITMQEIYDANQIETLLKNHKSIYIQEVIYGEVWGEIYLTKDYVYNYIPDEESDWLEFITDDVSYYYIDSDCVRCVPIAPDGVSDFASLRAERSASSALIADALDYTIKSASEKDGRITVKAFLGQDILDEKWEEFGLTSAKLEYVLDAKTHEIISLISDYTYDDGTSI